MARTKLSHADWVRVVLIAGVGTILEWFDFYTYAQLSSTLKTVFFPKHDPTAQTLLWWAVYAVGFVVRPLGALIFGHIGDTLGRNTTLRIAIFCMAIPTVIISCLPTYSIGPYTAGVAAPILLTTMRLCQGLAMGGEFGPAIIYMSELAPAAWRGRLVATLQMAVNVGMVLATALVMILESATDEYQMQVWGWRIPFAMAFLTAILGYYLRQGLPEPQTFLTAARAELFEDEQEGAENGNGAAPANGVAAARSQKEEDDDAASSVSSAWFEEAFEPEELGALTKLRGHHRGCKIPVLRLLANNSLGLFIQFCYMAWVSAAFYAAVVWLPEELRDAGLKPIYSQGIVIISMVTNAAGLLAVGTAFDKGVRAIWINLGVTIIGMSTGFGFFRGMWDTASASSVDTTAVWFLIPVFQLIVGVAMAAVVLPSTRIYAPLERTTGFSFGYNCGYGVIGGLTPYAVSGIKKDLGGGLDAYAPAFWLLALGGAAIMGCGLLRMYAPRINKPFIGRIE